MKQTSTGKEHHTRWKIIEDSIPVSSKSFLRHLSLLDIQLQQHSIKTIIFA